MKVKRYAFLVKRHLQKANCKVVSHKKLGEIYDKAIKLLDKLDPVLDKGEAEYTRAWVKQRRIPTPRLLSKDHKPAQYDGEYPTRMLNPATSFTQCFGNVGYRAVKATFDENRVCYTERTIINSRNLKEKLEGLTVRKGEATVSSLDIKDMYPSITFQILTKAVEYFSQNFCEADKERIRNALEMWQFPWATCY